MELNTDNPQLPPPNAKDSSVSFLEAAATKYTGLDPESLLSQTDHFITMKEIKLPWESLHGSRGVP